MQRRSGKEVRRLVLAAAEEIMQRDGLDALSIRDLAARTGYSPSALYKHFEGKEDVVSSLKKTFQARVVGRMKKAVEKPGAPAEKLRRGLRAYVKEGLSNPRHYAEAFCDPASAGADEPQSAAEDANAAGKQAFDMLQGLIADGIACGDFSGRDLKSAALSLWAAVHGLTLILICFPSQKWGPPDRVIDAHIDFILASLEKNPPAPH